MKGLLLRLSMVDADAEAAVRVIAYFDALVEHRATLAALVRSTAALAECPAGLTLPGRTPLRSTAEGRPVPAGTPVAESGGMDLDPAGRVWLERPGPAGRLDDLVLERFAVSARVLSQPQHRTLAPHLADPALVELVLAEREAAEDRSRALRLLGFDAPLRLRVLAISASGGDPPRDEAIALLRPRRPLRPLRMAVIGDVVAVLLQPREDGAVVADLRAALADRGSRPHAGNPIAPGLSAPTSPIGLRVGVGDAVPGLAARTSWLQARLALRFAEPGGTDEALIEHATLGSLTLLAQVPAEQLRADPGVAALNALAATPGGALDVLALEAFCRTGSLRQAATALHLHHSSVAARLAHVEAALGWRLNDPDARFRARFALLARRLSG
jgi:hypothetical protein